MATTAIEDYLKQIYLQMQDPARTIVSTGRLARAMSVVPGTATAMVKRLAKSRLVSYEPYTGVKLTAKGQKVAMQVLRRHRLVETFLVETLGLDWTEVHDEAERLEHAISDRLLDRIDAFLGHPTVDPHGDPIPAADGEVREASTVRLIDLDAGRSCVIRRILDQSEAFLTFVDQSRLRPGRRVTVERVDRAADAVAVRLRGAPTVAMSAAVARKFLVEPVG